MMFYELIECNIILQEPSVILFAFNLTVAMARVLWRTSATNLNRKSDMQM